MHRFFVPPECISQDGVIITGNLVHQLRNVLRLGPGDEIIVLDNSGWEYLVRLEEVERGRARGAIQDKSPSTSEPRIQITLYQATLKGDTFEFVLQKWTELGLAGFIPIICQRSVANVSDNKVSRWWRVIVEAAEQSRRGRVPLLYPAITFEEACRSQSGLSLLPWEGEGEQGLRPLLKKIRGHPRSLNLFIGPEGGFTKEEAELAQKSGVIAVTLGGRILRAETAGLVCASAILYEYGDLGG